MIRLGFLMFLVSQEVFGSVEDISKPAMYTVPVQDTSLEAYASFQLSSLDIQAGGKSAASLLSFTPRISPRIDSLNPFRRKIS